MFIYCASDESHRVYLVDCDARLLNAWSDKMHNWKAAKCMHAFYFSLYLTVHSLMHQSCDLAWIWQTITAGYDRRSVFYMSDFYCFMKILNPNDPNNCSAVVWNITTIKQTLAKMKSVTQAPTIAQIHSLHTHSLNLGKCLENHELWFWATQICLHSINKRKSRFPHPTFSAAHIGALQTIFPRERSENKWAENMCFPSGPPDMILPLASVHLQSYDKTLRISWTLEAERIIFLP